jgi:hypothetical protein
MVAMPVIHLVYPYGDRIHAPQSIGRSLFNYLSAVYEVRQYQWDSNVRIKPKEGDILLGHPHPYPFTVFRRSFNDDKWAKRIVMCPFTTNLEQIGYLLPYLRKCDVYLSICGPYWETQMLQSEFASIAERFVRLDMAIDTADFLPIESPIRSPGHRKFVYIGNDSKFKNTSFLRQLADARPNWFSWIGTNENYSEFDSCIPFLDFSIDSSRNTLSNFDFMVTTGSSDANPTTILESMSWGLIPVCSPESGYTNIEGIINLDIHDLEKSLATIDALQFSDESYLRSLRLNNYDLVTSTYSWTSFCSQVVKAIESKPREIRNTLPYAIIVKAQLRALVSPYSIFRPKNLSNLTFRFLKNQAKKVLKHLS